MKTPQEVVAARLAQEEETQNMVKFCRNRLEAITDAVQGYTTEYGTCCEQDELLFLTGFRNDLQNARTSCGFSLDIKRQPDGRLLASNIPAETWLGPFARRPVVFVPRVGLVQVPEPSREDLIDCRISEELGSNALCLLPPWGRDAVRAAYVGRCKDEIGGLPASPMDPE